MAEQRNPDPASETARLEEITRIVLGVVSEWDTARRRPQGRLAGVFGLLSSHWPLLAFVLSVGAVLIASFLYDASLLYPFKELAFREQELVHREKEFTHKQIEYQRKAEQARFNKDMSERHLDLAKSFLDVGQFKEANHAYRQALNLDPLNVTASMGLIKSGVFELALDGQYDPEVIKARLDFILEQDPNDAHAYTALGNLYAKLDRDKAIAAYTRAIKRDPDVAEAHFGLATLHLKKNQYAKALAPLEHAMKLSPWNPRYLESLAYVYAKKGNFKDAVTHYRKVIALDGDYLSPYFEIANAYRLNNQLDSAERVQKRLIALLGEGRITKLQKNHGRLYFPTEDGHPIYLHTLPQKQCYAYYNLSATLYLLKKEEEAATYAERAVALQAAGETSVKKLVAYDLKQVQDHHPSMKSRIGRYTGTFLNDRPGTDSTRRPGS